MEINNVDIEQNIGTQSGVLEKALSENTAESEQIPTWFQHTVKTVADAWFDPKSFEKDPKLYEQLGIKTFKKYMPTTGDLMSKLVWKRLGFGSWVKKDIDSLKGMETWTRVYEGIHLTGVGVMTAMMADAVHSGNMSGAAFAAGINTVFNIYPIMLQRYNRSRLYQTINHLEERNAHKTPEGHDS